MKLLAKFQSVSDIITNSSSEIFTIIDERPFEEIKRIIEEVGKSNLPPIYDHVVVDNEDKYDKFSGEGGVLEVLNWKDRYNEWLEWIPDNKKSQATPEVWSIPYEYSLEDLKKQILIRIDWNRKHTINWILNNLWVIDADCGYFKKDPKTGRVISRVSYEEYMELPDNEIVY